MSYYLAAIIRNESLERARRIFRADETSVITASENWSVLFVSRSGRVLSDGSIFQGYSIDHDNAVMAFSDANVEDCPDPGAPVDGCYLRMTSDGNLLRFGADIYGLTEMLWFTDSAVSAISDSFYALVELRRALGLRCTPNMETIEGRMWLNSMSFQQLGTETMLAEIEYTPPGGQLVFDWRSEQLRSHPPDLRQLFQSTFESHKEAVSRAAARMVRTMKSYVESGAGVSLGLSGGMDSRLCLAAILDAPDLSRVNIASHRDRQPDFAVATHLAETFSFKLNTNAAQFQGSLTRNDQQAIWVATCAGVYDALYTPQSFRATESLVFSVSGHGAEASKGNFGWRPLSAINMPLAGRAQSERALRRVGLESDDKWGSEWHYLVFRNAIHSGRALMSTDYPARPAQQEPLIGLSRSELNNFPAPGKTGPNCVLDVLIKTNPDLAKAPFDDRRKNVSEEFIDSRLKELGGRLDAQSLPAYRIAGTATPSPGPTQSFLALARERGFTGTLSAASLAPRVSRVRQDFAGMLSPAVANVLDQMDPNDTSRLPASNHFSGAVGKVLALSALFGA